MKNELSNFMKEVTKQILELRKKVSDGWLDVACQILELQKKVKFLEEQDIKSALYIHNLQKHTGTHPHEEKK